MTSISHPPAARVRAAGGRGAAAGLLRGRAGDVAWARPALAGLLLLTAVLYLWGLSASGWANGFYSAAAQAGATSWKAFFFGSLDGANAITVDKTPAALWVMGLSARLFGVGSWSVLVPQALMGVGTVGLLYATVRRSFGRTSRVSARTGAAAGLLAGAALALTPVAALMFRFDNPDALLVLLLVAAAYATLRAAERGATGWLVLAGACVGFGFLAKMLQAFLVVPAFALVYLLAAPTTVRRRVAQVLAAGAALVAAGGWWVAIVQLVPASARPYIGGSQHNSVLELTLGYNGFGRLTGAETGGLGNTNQDAGVLRLFGAELGGQVAWLLPAALVLLVAIVWILRRAPRTHPLRAAALLWGGWLVVTGAVFSLMNGIFHAYYTVALAPAVAALFGMGVAYLWTLRGRRPAALTLAAVFAVTAVWAYALLTRTPEWQPWLRWAVLVGGLPSAAAVAASAVPSVRARARRWGRRAVRRAAPVAVLAAVVTALAGPAAYAVQTAATPHTGAIPSAGPSGQGGRFGGGLGGGFGGGHGTGRGGPPGMKGRPGGGWHHQGAGPGNGQARPGGRPPGTGGRTGVPSTGGGMRGTGGPGGLLGGGTPSAAVTSALKADAGSYTWVAATAGANNAAGYQLATGRPVMALGGFNGTDPSPTLEQFQRYVSAGKIHYYIGGGTTGGGRGGPGGGASGSQDAQRIATWVAQHYTATTVAGVTLYDLST